MSSPGAAVLRLAGGPGILALAWASAQLFGARILGQASGFSVAILAARWLGPDAFGVYAFAVAAAALLAQVPGAGLDLSAVRVSAGAWHSDPAYARGVLALAALVKAAFGGLLALGGLVLADPVATHVLGHPELAMPLAWAALAAAAFGVTDSMLAALQARECFGQMFVVNVSAALLKLLPVLALQAVGWLSSQTALFVFVLAAGLGCASSIGIAWPTWAGRVRVDRAAARRLLSMSPWLVIATLVAAIATNLDVLVLASLLGPQATGVYSSGRTLAMPLAIVSVAVGSVLLPKLARQSGEPGLRRSAQQVAWRCAAAASLIAAMLVAAAPWLVRLAYSNAYSDAIAVFQILVVAHSLDLITWPAIDLLLVLDRPNVVAGLNGIFLGATVIGLLALVPLVGPAGAAWAVLGGRALIVLPYVLVLWAPGRATSSSTRPDDFSVQVSDA